MIHDRLHDVEGRTGVLYDNTLPCRVCLLIEAARLDERRRLRMKAQAAYLAAVPARQGRMTREQKARVAAAALVVRMMMEED